MRRALALWTRALASTLVLFLGVTLAVPPLAAGDLTTAPAPSTTRQHTLAAETSARLAAMPIPTRAMTQVAPPPGAPAEEAKSFFRRPAGIAAIVLMAAGTSYMIYSASHDRKPVKSPIR